MKDFKCDRCGTAVDMEDVAYMGADDPNDTSCGPFTKMTTICRQCWTGEDHRALREMRPLTVKLSH